MSVETAARTDRGPCVHQVTTGRSVTSDRCGSRGLVASVYWCNEHERECLTHRLLKVQRQRVCQFCDDWSPLETSTGRIETDTANGD